MKVMPAKGLEVRHRDDKNGTITGYGMMPAPTRYMQRKGC